MSPAVAVPDAPTAGSPSPDSYEARARSLLLRRPDLFLRSGRSGGFAVRGRESLVQPAPRTLRTGGRRRRGGRQLKLPLTSLSAAMLR